MNSKAISVVGGMAMMLVAAIVIVRSVGRPEVVKSGCFHQVAHTAAGCAAIVRLPDGSARLELSGLTAYRSDELEVVVTSLEDAFENDSVRSAVRVSLGMMSPDGGDQVFKFPAGKDIGEFNSATIWNVRYEVNFATAPLNSTH